METIVKMIFGSHLYGTSSEESDTDYKGVFLPSKDECFLDNIPKSINKTTGGKGKNTSDDVDEEMYSLQYFMHLAHKGEMIVIDMLHAPDDMIIESSDIWDSIRANRSVFYSKNMHGYLGYIRKQTAKYSVKGERLSAMKEVLDFLNQFDKPEITKLEEVWLNIPVNDYCFEVVLPQEERWRMYEIAGKRLQESVTIEYAINVIQANYDRYGSRAKKAELNDGIDWKAVSHAFRAAYQLEELLTTGDLKYPLKDAQFIKDIKYGKYHWKNDNIGDKLDELLDDIEELVTNSDWPEKVDRKKLDEQILSIYKNN
jgi:predicted nucleotidyltransferase